MREDIQRMFEAQSLAVVGSLKREGGLWLRIQSGFKGKLYAVNPSESGKTFNGVPVYPSVLEIPDRLDFVILAIPAEVIPGVIEECIEKEVKTVCIFSAGYSELNTKEGIEREKELLEIADGRINILGPNCMGIYYPKNGMTFNPNTSSEMGTVAFVAQSGGHAINFALRGNVEGIRFSKVISYGNGCMFDSTDFVEYLIDDPETEIIGLYVEGVRDGRRFFEVLKRASAKKPVMLWKGGQTEEGAKAAISHTGSFAGDIAVWNTLMKQCGCIKVDTIEELIETTLAFLSPTPNGRKTGLLSVSGGRGVVFTDIVSKSGLEIPSFSERTKNRLRKRIFPVGSSIENPLDSSASWLDPANAIETIKIIVEDETIDSVLVELTPDLVQRWHETHPEYMKKFFENLGKIKEKAEKPFFVILPFSYLEEYRIEIKRELVKNGIPVYSSFSAAASSLSRVVRRFFYLREREIHRGNSLVS
ncbi:MAG: CoA-binding protein [Candidatus Syntropharchaeia archaeon]